MSLWSSTRCVTCSFLGETGSSDRGRCFDCWGGLVDRMLVTDDGFVGCVLDHVCCLRIWRRGGRWYRGWDFRGVAGW